MLSWGIQAERITNSENLRQIKAWYVKKQEKKAVCLGAEWVRREKQRENEIKDGRPCGPWWEIWNLCYGKWEDTEGCRQGKIPDNLYFKEIVHLPHKSFPCTILPILSPSAEVPEALKEVRVTGRKVSGSLDNLKGVLVLARNTNVGLLWSKNKLYVLSQWGRERRREGEGKSILTPTWRMQRWGQETFHLSPHSTLNRAAQLFG